MNKCKITILTNPVGFRWNVRNFIRRYFLKRPLYGGHIAVTRSLIEGFQKIGFDEYNYQPHSEKDIAEHVHVLAGIKTLEYAIKLKREGKIKRLTAGPNVVVFSDDFNGIIASEEIDLYLQPSEWATRCHIRYEKSLEGRCTSWPAGIDLNKYPIKKKSNTNRVLIYHKDEGDQFLYRVDYLLRRKGYETVIIKYGHYMLDDYIRALEDTDFAVFIARQESQGLCLVEAWAMNVPTFCFEPNYYRWTSPNTEREVAGDISTAPYLNDQNGRTWFELSELEALLDQMDELLDGMHPREWVEKNMTDEVCAKLFLERVL